MNLLKNKYALPVAANGLLLLVVLTILTPNDPSDSRYLYAGLIVVLTLLQNVPRFRKAAFVTKLVPFTITSYGVVTSIIVPDVYTLPGLLLLITCVITFAVILVTTINTIANKQVDSDRKLDDGITSGAMLLVLVAYHGTPLLLTLFRYLARHYNAWVFTLITCVIVFTIVTFSTRTTDKNKHMT